MLITGKPFSRSCGSEQMSQEKIIILSGPTATGKSRLAIELALNLRARGIPAEIISADSAQIYRHMDIGTDKLKPDQWQGIPHHLIDVANPDEHFDAEIFRKMAGQEIARINQSGGIAILVGGTGFWIHTLIYGLFRSPPRNEELRADLKKAAREKGSEYLHKKLMKIDPESAQRIHPNDIFRLVRALEVHQLTGKPLSEHFKEQTREPLYNALYFALNLPREVLYQRINKRVDEMLAKGLLDEVKNLRQMGYGPELASQKIIGYKELHEHLDGKKDLPSAVHEIKKETRHYARRQLIWLRKEKDVVWVDAIKAKEIIMERVKGFLEL